MAIQVTCPGCLKRFNVSEKYAGKSGPCPSCQKQIKIPELKDQVVIHAPDEAEPKDAKGRSIFSPIRRTETRISAPVILGIALAAVVIFGIALGLRFSSGGAPTLLLAVAAVALAPPLGLAGYWFLRDDELGGYEGRPLWIRCGICGAAFAALWGVYAMVPRYIDDTAQSMADISGMWMAIMLLVVVAIGTAVSVATFELEVGQGAMHYILYLGVTFALAWTAGVPLASPLAPATPAQATSTPPAEGATDPGTSAPGQAAPGPGRRGPARGDAKPPAELPQNVPNLLQ